MGPPKGPQPWVRWFAWYPVRMNLRGQYAWLEWVERQRIYPYDWTRKYAYWEYREIAGDHGH